MDSRTDYEFVVKDLKLRIKSPDELIPDEHYSLYKLRVVNGDNKFFSRIDFRDRELKIFMDFLDRNGFIDSQRYNLPKASTNEESGEVA